MNTCFEISCFTIQYCFSQLDRQQLKNMAAALTPSQSPPFLIYVAFRQWQLSQLTRVYCVLLAASLFQDFQIQFLSSAKKAAAPKSLYTAKYVFLHCDIYSNILCAKVFFFFDSLTVLLEIMWMCMIPVF